MLLPIAQRSGAPVLLINLQPTEAMDHATFDTGQWLAYLRRLPAARDGQHVPACRHPVPFGGRGYVEDERAWTRIGRWVRAAGVRGALRHGRHGLMGHLYPGMLDVSTDLTLVRSTSVGTSRCWSSTTCACGSIAVSDADVDTRIALATGVFEIDPTVVDEDFRWAARVSVGLDRLVADFELDSLAYYHRGLDGEQHERLGAGMILGASLLTARVFRQRGSTSCGRRSRC